MVYLLNSGFLQSVEFFYKRLYVTSCSKVEDTNHEEANNSLQLELVSGVVFY